ncbi:MAG: DUF488 domain-containing protein [Anaerolineae bacterium]|nr:DUF488 domain-containing protein [Anaerolineae bacterium]
MPILHHPSSNIHLPSSIYTVGHSDHTTAAFVDLLGRHGITLVVDVRSQPYSRWTPQFNRETLARDLQPTGIAYRHMGDVLGGRPTDPSLYDLGEDHPDYERMEQAPVYQSGIDQVLQVAQEERVAVMCSEGDYHCCHRHLLITQTLRRRGVRVLHIQTDGTTVQGELIPKQLSMFG